MFEFLKRNGKRSFLVVAGTMCFAQGLFLLPADEFLVPSLCGYLLFRLTGCYAKNRSAMEALTLIFVWVFIGSAALLWVLEVLVSLGDWVTLKSTGDWATYKIFLFGLLLFCGWKYGVESGNEEGA